MQWATLVLYVCSFGYSSLFQQNTITITANLGVSPTVKEGTMATSRYPEGLRYRSNDDWKSSTPQHSLGYRITNRVRTAFCMIIIAILAFVTTILAAVWMDFSSTVSNRVVNVIAQDKQAAQTIDVNAGKPVTFLVLGQDSRDGNNRSFTNDDEVGDHQSDTTMVVQISADRTYMNIVSIPRDSMVNAPACETSKGHIPARRHVMFNSIFANGYAQGGDLASAASCSMKAVNALTGLHIQHFIVTDFSGLSNMIDAIGGVSLCIPTDTRDLYTGVNFKQGMQHLNGRMATQYARMRHDSASDGSDIMRTTRQQYLIKQLVHQALSKNLFTQTGELYQLAKSALGALNISEGMANPSTLAGLALSMRKIDTSHIYARTTPVIPDPYDPNRVVWSDEADDIWERMRENKPLSLNHQAVQSSKKQSKKSAHTRTKNTDNKKNDSVNSTDDDISENDRLNDVSTSASTSGTINPKTGLIRDSQGQLIDPNTGGIVNPKNGTIHNPETGQYVGIADKYMNNVLCAVPHKK